MSSAPDTLVVTGPNFEQEPIDYALVTPTGGVQMKLRDALAFGANLSMPPAIGNVIPNTGAFTTLSGSVTATGSTASRTLADRFSEVKDVKDYGAKGDGASDDTASIQMAYDAVSSTGGTVWWPDGNYKTSATIFAKSHTLTLFSGGAVVQPVPIAGFTPVSGVPGVSGVFGYLVFANQNLRATSVTDTWIVFENIRIEPTAPWNGHGINLRMVSNVRVTGGRFISLDDAVAGLACDGFMVEDTYAGNIGNAAWDFWETPKNVTIRNNKGVSVVNGVQFNAFDTSMTSGGAASNLLVDGNTIAVTVGCCINIGPSPGVNLPSSSVSNIRIVNNTCDNSGSTSTFASISLQRVIGSDISGNTIKSLTNQPAITVNLDLAGASDTTLIEDNLILDSACGGNAYLVVQGPRAIVRGNAARNSTAGVGVQISDPTTILGPNPLVGATTAYLNSTTAGVPTTPAMQIDANTTTRLWVFTQPISVPVVYEAVDYGVTATGTNAATAFPLVKPYTFFSSTPSGTGAILPAASLGSEFVVFNNGGNPLTVYPNAGASIAFGSATLANGTGGRFICVNAALWLRA